MKNNQESALLLRDRPAGAAPPPPGSPSAVYVLRVEEDRVAPVWVSESITRIAGYDTHEMLGSHRWWLDRIHPEDQPRVAAHQLLLFEQNHLTQAYRFQHKNGDYVWVTDERKLLRDAAGKPLEIVGTWHGASSCKEAVEALRESEKRYQILTKMAPVGIFHTDAEGNYRYVNECWRELADLTLEEAAGAGWTQALHPDDREWVSAEWQRAARLNLPFKAEYRFRRRDGVVTWVLGQAVAEWDASGELAGYIGTIIDVTEHRRIERALRKSEERLNRAQKIAQLGSWDWDIVSGELVWSEETYRIFGRQAQNFHPSYESFMATVHPEDQSSLAEALKQALFEHRLFRIDHRIILPDGAERFVHEEAEISYADDGRALRMVGTVQDITARKEAEEEIRRLNAELEQRVEERTAELLAANRELESFSYSVSHDLRAPLRAINGFTQILLNDHAACLNEEGRRHLERVLCASERMGQLIDDLLNLSRITRSEMHREWVNLSTLAQQIAETLQAGQPERSVAFVIAPNVVARGDARLLQIVLENLLGNAWKFTGKHARARIEFGTVQLDGKRSYFVRDDGAGFDMSYADKLFGAFQRLHGASEFEGTGIGLVTIQRIIARHGGRIWAEGAVEQGATFYFTLN
ncbi:PAS domain-containing protein [Thermithiobacillus tepidarius DSM 3134]|uniref:PAS domain-containing sensor histidine kinase n=1 Tax=Thermithiobacillus tepidarius TaxID=929 RepID=UPI000415D164|nr:PAS domain-containing sensor histidine kinase [Thermithiobacillus tepidarius]